DDRQESPENRIWNPDEEQSDADRNAVGHIDNELCPEIAAHPTCRIIDRLRVDIQPAAADQVDETITEILPFDKQEQDEDDDDGRRSKWCQDRRENISGNGEYAHLSRYALDGHRLLTWRFLRGACGWAIEFLLDFGNSGG